MKYFGTDGIRSTFGKSFLNEKFSFALGEALARFMKEKKIYGKKVLIGRDTRPSGKMLLNSFCQGLKTHGFSGISAGILPTPALAFGVILEKMAMGVMITASHNPYQDNGFKFFSALGTKLSDSEEESIEKNILIKDVIPTIIEIQSVEILNSYINYILEIFPRDLVKNKKIVIDLSNGATQQTTPFILKKLGAEIHPINSGSGAINEGVGSENPQIMSQKVREIKADFGIAHDGDGDRVIFCDSFGEVIPGDKILGLLAIHEKKPFPDSLEEIKMTAQNVKDPNFRIQITSDGLHVYNRDGLRSGQDPFQFYEKLGVEEDSSHAFYLGVELARAEIAWSLGKRYAQDRGLDWGAAAEPRREDALTHCQPKIKKKIRNKKNTSK